MWHPTIATAVGGLKEFVRSQRGYSVPPGDPDALREKIRRVLDPENRSEVESMRRGTASGEIIQYTEAD